MHTLNSISPIILGPPFPPFLLQVVLLIAKNSAECTLLQRTVLHCTALHCAVLRHGDVLVLDHDMPQPGFFPPLRPCPLTHVTQKRNHLTPLLLFSTVETSNTISCFLSNCSMIENVRSKSEPQLQFQLNKRRIPTVVGVPCLVVVTSGS